MIIERNGNVLKERQKRCREKEVTVNSDKGSEVRTRGGSFSFWPRACC